MADWLLLLLPLAGLALGAGLLARAEWRFARLEHVGPIDAIEDALELDWMLPSSLTGQVRVVVRPGEDLGRTVVDGQSRRVAARSSVERAWRPWGSKRYLVEIAAGAPAGVQTLLRWELHQRVIPHSQGRGWGPAFVPAGGRDG